MKSYSMLAICVGLVIALGCNQGATTTTTTEKESSPAIDGGQFLLTSEPADANDVIKIREAAKDGDDVTIVGRIGGSHNPWVEGRAAFSIVDGSLKACSDIPGDKCPAPWDYCCETGKLPTSTALVKVVDAEGKLINSDARKLFNLKELQTVVVKGKAKRDDAGNLTVFASGIFVRN